MSLKFSYQSIIFDLDGTLIDSAPGILCSFSSVLKRAGIQPRLPLNESLIGPPLRQTLMDLTGLLADDALEKLVIMFQEIYDTEGYKATRIYPGVDDLLSGLVIKKIPLAIATNKRRIPTLKILDYFGWGQHFQMVGTLDTPRKLHTDKAALIKSILVETKGDAIQSPYIGDKWEDGEAAKANDMPFIAAGWGYGNWDTVSIPLEWELANSPYDLKEKLSRGMS